MDNTALALILSKTLELGVTEYGINKNYFREGNPIIQDRPTRIIINAAYGIGSVVIYKELKKSKPKLAKGLAIGIIIGHGYLVMHNVRRMK